MKKLALGVVLSLFCMAAKAQTTAVKYPPLDASPMDVAYFPVNAAKVKKEDTSMPIVTVYYSRPAKKGREVFGVLEQFDKVWRLGANESTVIAFDRQVTIGDTKLKAGRYGLFAIPSKDKWTIIVNKQTDRWGAFSYDQSKDLVRVDVPIVKLDKVVESFSIALTDAPNGANLNMAWDTTQATLPIIFKK